MQRHQTVFRLGGDAARQAEFCSRVTQLVRDTEFVAFGTVIRREAFNDFLRTETDPYLPWNVYAVAIHLLMERYVDYLAAFGKRSLGRVTFESQGPVEDAQHQAVFADLLLSGTQWVPDKAFRNWLETSARFVPKDGSHGTELADMLSRCLYEWVRDGCKDETRSERWDAFCAKVHSRGDQRMGKFGIKVFPDSDIRGVIEAHRAASGRS